MQYLELFRRYLGHQVTRYFTQVLPQSITKPGIKVAYIEDMVVAERSYIGAPSEIIILGGRLREFNSLESVFECVRFGEVVRD